MAELEKIIADSDYLADSWFKDQILAGLSDVAIKWVDQSKGDELSGIVAIQVITPNRTVLITKFITFHLK